MIGEPKEPTIRVGRIAPIFLSYEPRLGEHDLFTYSQAFYAKHKEGNILPNDFGMVSGLWHYDEVDENGKRVNLPPYEAIAFDTRDERGYLWELSYADSGWMRAVQLSVTEQQSQGIYVQTSTQGALVEIFSMTAAETSAVEEHLVERLQSPEVLEGVEQIYLRRETTKNSLVNLVNERNIENRKFAKEFGIPLARVSPARAYDYQISAYHRQLETLGFPPLMIFKPDWLERLNT